MAVHKWIEIFLPSAMAAVPRYRVNLVLFSPPGGVTILPIRLENIGADSLEIDPASHYHSMMEEPADQTNKQQSPTNVATMSRSRYLSCFFFPFVLFFVIFLVAFFFRSKFCLAYTMYGCRVFVPSFLIVDFGSTTLFLLTEPGGGWWNFSTKAFAFTRASSSANLSSCRSITSGKASIFSDTFACFNHLLNLKFEAALPFCLV